jgi:hypothetical protein
MNILTRQGGSDITSLPNQVGVKTSRRLRAPTPFCNINPEHAKLFHATRLLWLHDFTGLEIILAHCSRSAQGAGPFHYYQYSNRPGKTASGSSACGTNGGKCSLLSHQL